MMLLNNLLLALACAVLWTGSLFLMATLVASLLAPNKRRWGICWRFRGLRPRISNRLKATSGLFVFIMMALFHHAQQM